MNQWRKNTGQSGKADDSGKIRPAILACCFITLAACVWLLGSKKASQTSLRSEETIQLVQTQSIPRDLVQQQKRRVLKTQEAESDSVIPGSELDMDLTKVAPILDDRQNWIEQPERRFRRLAQP